EIAIGWKNFGRRSVRSWVCVLHTNRQEGPTGFKEREEENTALGTRVSGAAGFRMSRSARRLYANSTQIPSRRYLYRSHTSEPAVAAGLLLAAVGCCCCWLAAGC
ncbi:hypothetical protein V1478_016963, partial [Vespula squamosa]